MAGGRAAWGLGFVLWAAGCVQDAGANAGRGAGPGRGGTALAQSAPPAQPGADGGVVRGGGAADAGALCDPACDYASDDALGAALSLPEPRRCFRRVTEFPCVAVLGSFAYDRGCRAGDVVVGCARMDAASATARVLGTMGWGAMGRDRRRELALRWAERVLLAFEGDLASGPRAQVQADGGVVVRAEVFVPAGMRRRTGPPRTRTVVYTLTADGRLVAGGG